jgi:hypothetical protein
METGWRKGPKEREGRRREEGAKRSNEYWRKDEESSVKTRVEKKARA